MRQRGREPRGDAGLPAAGAEGVHAPRRRHRRRSRATTSGSPRPRAVLHRPASHADGPSAPDGCGNDCAPLLQQPHDPALDHRLPRLPRATTHEAARTSGRGDRLPAVAAARRARRVRDAGAARRHRLPARAAARRRTRRACTSTCTSTDPAAAAAEVERLGAEVLASPYDDLTTCGRRAASSSAWSRSRWRRARRRPPGPTAARRTSTRSASTSRRAAYDDELAFWAAVTGWRRRDPAPGSEFGRCHTGPDQPLQLLLQRLDDEQDTVSAHLDWAASDHEAEVAAHAGRRRRGQGRFEGWTVLRDPAGLTYCITRRRPGDRPE